MGRRRKAREIALQVLFQIEFNDSQIDQIIDRQLSVNAVEKDTEDYSRWLVKNVVESKENLDEIIQSVSEHWRLPRMAVIDRNILRMAVFELCFEENITPAIVINEAIEIAKKYSGRQAANFINGVLDAIRLRREQEKKNSRRETNE